VTQTLPLPGVFVNGVKGEQTLISLDGLLDYNENDKHEGTFEVKKTNKHKQKNKQT